MVFLSRHGDVKAPLSDRRFDNDGEAWGGEELRGDGMVFGAGTLIGRILTVLDPPDHTRVRGPATGAFTPRQVAA